MGPIPEMSNGGDVHPVRSPSKSQSAVPIKSTSRSPEARKSSSPLTPPPAEKIESPQVPPATFEATKAEGQDVTPGTRQGQLDVPQIPTLAAVNGNTDSMVQVVNQPNDANSMPLDPSLVALDAQTQLAAARRRQADSRSPPNNVPWAQGQIAGRETPPAQPLQFATHTSSSPFPVQLPQFNRLKGHAPWPLETGSPAGSAPSSSIAGSGLDSFPPSSTSEFPSDSAMGLGVSFDSIYSQLDSRQGSVSDLFTNLGATKGSISSESGVDPIRDAFADQEERGKDENENELDAEAENKEGVVPAPKPKKSHARKQPPGHIKRARNAFILFRKHVTDSGLIPPSVEQKHQNISVVAAKMWREAPQDVREKFQEQARLEKEEHQRKYPEYRYQPIFRRTDIIRRRVRKDPVEDEKVEVMAEALIKGKKGDELENEVKDVLGDKVEASSESGASTRSRRRRRDVGQLSKGALRAQRAQDRARKVRQQLLGGSWGLHGLQNLQNQAQYHAQQQNQHHPYNQHLPHMQGHLGQAQAQAHQHYMLSQIPQHPGAQYALGGAGDSGGPGGPAVDMPYGLAGDPRMVYMPSHLSGGGSGEPYHQAQGMELGMGYDGQPLQHHMGGGSHDMEDMTGMYRLPPLQGLGNHYDHGHGHAHGHEHEQGHGQEQERVQGHGQAEMNHFLAAAAAAAAGGAGGGSWKESASWAGMEYWPTSAQGDRHAPGNHSQHQHQHPDFHDHGAREHVYAQSHGHGHSQGYGYYPDPAIEYQYRLPPLMDGAKEDQAQHANTGGPTVAAAGAGPGASTTAATNPHGAQAAQAGEATGKPRKSLGDWAKDISALTSQAQTPSGHVVFNERLFDGALGSAGLDGVGGTEMDEGLGAFDEAVAQANDW